jgi:hypothetical protein
VKVKDFRAVIWSSMSVLTLEDYWGLAELPRVERSYSVWQIQYH